MSCGQPSTPCGRVALATASSVRPFCARLMHHLYSVTPGSLSLIPHATRINDATVSRKPLISFTYFNWVLSRAASALFFQIPSHLKAVLPEDDAHTNICLATTIFTPLLEYKLRQTFTTPYLVLMFYSNLASTNDLVLTRDEITPSVTTKLSTRDYLLIRHDV